MSDKLSLEELKMKNEILKNKTEKLRLVRNIVAVGSIILSIIVVLFFKNANISNKSNLKTPPQTTNSQNNNTNDTTINNTTNNSDENSNSDQEDVDDEE